MCPLIQFVKFHLCIEGGAGDEVKQAAESTLASDSEESSLLLLLYLLPPRASRVLCLGHGELGLANWGVLGQQLASTLEQRCVIEQRSIIL